MTKASKRQRAGYTSTAQPPAEAKGEEDPNNLQIHLNGLSKADAIAQYVLLPEVQAGLTIKNFERGPMTGASLNQLVERLAEQSALSNKGDLTRAESLLTAQAHTLDAIFHDLARRAAQNAGQYMDACDMYLRLTLKAQSQCRATIEALAEIKNPSHVTFAKQANIANGPQQVNNGEPSRGENQIAPNKLLEQTNGERLDFGAQGQAIGSHSAMETVGAINRSKDTDG
jgi:hypothetical protein